MPAGFGFMPLTNITAIEFNQVFSYMQNRYEDDVFERGV